MLGILGGMGPLATVDFMTKVIRNTPASYDQDHIEMIVSVATKIPDRTRAILEQGEDPFPLMRKAAHDLVEAGATLIAIPCNTAHFWYDALQKEVSVPIIHVVDAFAEALPPSSRQGSTVGILATDGTIQAEIYQKRLEQRGIRCLSPDKDGQADVMAAIRHVKAGDIPTATGILERQAERLVERGCAAVAMACTEIPLALLHPAPALAPFLVDPTEALALACINAYDRPATPILLSA